jgi:hypothetical protein
VQIDAGQLELAVLLPRQAFGRVALLLLLLLLLLASWLRPVMQCAALGVAALLDSADESVDESADEWVGQNFVEPGRELLLGVLWGLGAGPGLGARPVIGQAPGEV